MPFLRFIMLCCALFLTSLAQVGVAAQETLAGQATSDAPATTDTATTDTSVTSNTTTTDARAASAPKPFSNQYISSALGFKITVTHELKQLEDDTYEMRFHAKSWFASIEEVSRLRVDAESTQVIPLHYTYKRRGIGKNRDAELTFDWDKEIVTNNVQNISWKMDITQRVQDKLSYQLQIQQDLRAGEKKFVYQIADGGRLKEYGFEVIGEEVLETPLGKVDTIQVKRSRDDDKRVTYAWLATDWDFLLVRMQQEEKGKTYDIDLDTAMVDGKQITSFD